MANTDSAVALRTNVTRDDREDRSPTRPGTSPQARCETGRPSWRCAEPMFVAGALPIAGAIGLRMLSVTEAYGLALPLALAAVLIGVWRQGPLAWLFAGAMLGGLYAGPIGTAVVKWGGLATFVLWASVTLGFALLLGLVGAIASRVPEGWRAWGIAGAWGGLVGALDQWIYPPVFLSAPWALWLPEARRLFFVLGASGVETLFVLTAASLSGLALTTTARRIDARHWIGVAVLPMLLGISALAPYPVAPSSTKGQGLLHAVQPSFSWEDYAARGWSLEARHHLETSLETLTRKAATREPGTIVWPENGAGLAEAQLASRRERLRASLAVGQSDLLIAGLETEQGARHVSVVQMRHDGKIVGVARKVHLVPIAESGVLPGPPAVLDTQAGKLGIAICFDILFRDHVRRLVHDGAELLVVTSDNASFGLSLISRWHVMYAVMRASEVGRSLLFTSNRGPVVAFDAAHNTVQALSSAGARTVVTAPLTRIAWRVQAPIWLHGLPIVLGGLVAAVALRRCYRGEQGPRTLHGVDATSSAPSAFETLVQPWRPTLVLLLVVTLIGCIFAAGFEVVETARVTQETPQQVVADLISRGRRPVGMNAVAPLFVQSQPHSCGLAALAFVMTVLGEWVFEEDLAREISPDDVGSTLDELAAAAERRGLQAEPLRAPGVAALALGPGRMALLHLRPSQDARVDAHYLSVWKEGRRILSFDPASGRVGELETTVAARWTGYTLRVSHPTLETLIP